MNLRNLRNRLPRRPAVLLSFICLVCLVASLVASPVALGALQADGDQPIDLNLHEASLSEVLESFARIAGGELDIAPEIDGDVTVDWKAIPWKRALDRLCRSHRISCYWSETHRRDSQPSRLVVRRSDGFVGLAESINMELRQAPLGIVLQSLDSIVSEAFRVEVDPEFDGVVDIQLSSTPWPEALKSICRPARCRLTWSPDAVLVEPHEDGIPPSGARTNDAAWKVVVDDPDLEQRVVELLDAADALGVDRPPFAELDALCEEMGCHWTVRWAESPRLVFTAGVAAGVSPTPATELRFGEDPVVLEASVSARGFRMSRAFAFGWDTPSHRLERAPGGDGPTVRLSWIPFSASRQVLLVYAIRCTGPHSESGRYEVKPPISLPLDGAWQASIRDAQIDVRAAGTPTAEGPQSAPTCADQPASFQMFLRLEDRPHPRGASGLPTRPGHYLLVTSPGEPGPGAALVYLGPNPDGSFALALVRAGADDGDPPSVERLDLAPGETWSRAVVSEDTGMRMYVTAEMPARAESSGAVDGRVN